MPDTSTAGAGDLAERPAPAVDGPPDLPTVSASDMEIQGALTKDQLEWVTRPHRQLLPRSSEILLSEHDRTYYWHDTCADHPATSDCTADPANPAQPRQLRRLPHGSLVVPCPGAGRALTARFVIAEEITTLREAVAVREHGRGDTPTSLEHVLKAATRTGTLPQARPGLWSVVFGPGPARLVAAATELAGSEDTADAARPVLAWLTELRAWVWQQTVDLRTPSTSTARRQAAGPDHWVVAHQRNVRRLTGRDRVRTSFATFVLTTALVDVINPSGRPAGQWLLWRTDKVTAERLHRYEVATDAGPVEPATDTDVVLRAAVSAWVTATAADGWRVEARMVPPSDVALADVLAAVRVAQHHDTEPASARSADLP